jgi:ribosome-interacting GTPase 1
MPANLPPEYFAAEKRFKEASTPREKTAALEELISTVPKHKGTDKLRADLRRRLSKLREESMKKKRSGKGDLYTVEKQGAAQVALVGFTNSGKSSLLAFMTNARPIIADYPLTTVMPLSGMMQFEDIQFQLIDLPPIGNESSDGWVSGILRTADMLILVIDLSEDPEAQVDLLLGQLSDWKILIRRSDNASEDKGQKPVIIAANKSDLPGAEQCLKALQQRYEAAFPLVSISPHAKTGSEALRTTVFAHSRIIRVYSKEPGKPPDSKTPFAIPAGYTVLELAELIHKDFIRNLRYACIWGSAKFDGQRVQKDYILHDRDIVEYHIK